MSVGKVRIRDIILAHGERPVESWGELTRVNDCFADNVLQRGAEVSGGAALHSQISPRQDPAKVSCNPIFGRILAKGGPRI